MVVEAGGLLQGRLRFKKVFFVFTVRFVVSVRVVDGSSHVFFFEFGGVLQGLRAKVSLGQRLPIASQNLVSRVIWNESTL